MNWQEPKQDITRMSLEEYQERASKVARALLKALEKLESVSRDELAEFHVLARDMGYAGVLVMVTELAVEVRARLSPELLTELQSASTESGDLDLIENHALLASPPAN